MISGLDLTQTVDFILKNDTDNPTVWKLGVVPSYVFARISEEASLNQTDTIYKLLQVALKGWDNFNVPYLTTKEKIFGREMEVVPLSVLESIPLKVINELSLKIMEINQLSESERKN